MSDAGLGPVGPGQTLNRITGGVFFGTVIQGRDIQMMLPAEVTPAMTGMPAPAEVFTGRDDEVETLVRGLAPGGEGGAVLVSAVAGMAGIGKTELVLQTADRALHTPGWFPGGVLFVDLFGYDPDRRLSAADALLGWLQAIGIPGEHIPAGEQDRARLWRSVVTAYVRQNHRLLLIIDNAADTAQVTPLPADTNIPVLVTSRHTLNIDARLHDLNVLDTAAAIDLITEVVALRRGDATRLGEPDQRQAMTELVDLCAGLPLALRIVAALLADRPQPASLASRLRDTRHRLDRMTRRETTSELAVRAAFDLSYRHLTPQQARLFRLLPVDPALDIGTTAAARLADLPADEATVLLQDLHRAHLVDEPAVDRWRMHDLIRMHAASQPADTPDEADTARKRLFIHYLRTAHAANTHLDPTVTADTTVFATREQALTWLDAERANLIAVCTTAPDHHLPHTSTGFAFTLAKFLDFRRYFDDWITIATLAVDVYRQLGNRHGEGRALDDLGLAMRQVGRFDEAITVHTQAANIFHQTGDRHGEGRALGNIGLGLAMRRVGRFDEAITAHTQAANIFRQLGDRHGEGAALDSLGLAMRRVGRFDEAITAHTQAANIFHQTGDRYRKGAALDSLGIALITVGRFDDAITAFTQAADIFHQTGDRHDEGLALNNLGLALAEVGRFDEAITASTQAANIFHQTDDRHCKGAALNNLGITMRQVGQFERARECGKEAARAFVDAGDTASAKLVRQWVDELPPATEDG